MKENSQKILNGINGAPGICIGKAHLIDSHGVDVIQKYYLTDELVISELKRFKTAVSNAKRELEEVICNSPESIGDHINILETHLLLFNDKMLYEKTLSHIKQNRINAEWALKNVVEETKDLFRSIEDEYLKSRGSDIVHVADKIMIKLTGAVEVNISDISKRVILVARDLSPAQTSQIQLDKIMGFLTDKGGTASHTSIIAKTLGIPCVIGLENATSRIKDDDIIIIDGSSGIVIINPEDSVLIKYEEAKRVFEEKQAEIVRSSYLPATTKDGVDLVINGNIEFTEEVDLVKNHGGTGIGLYRTEFLYMSKNHYPDENEQFENYKEVGERIYPGEVIIRTLDINGDKALSYNKDDIEELNPALGLRAIRFCLKRKKIFKTQIRAILKASAFGNIKILFPMISSLGELNEAKKIVKICMTELSDEGINFNPDIKIGIMVEIPSTAVMADIFAKEVDFFSLGTNDLIQYSLAIDRGNEEVAHLYNELNPAILRLIQNTASAAKENNIPVAVCGEMAGNPMFIPVLLGLGILNFSMNPHSIPIVKQFIREINFKDIEKLTSEILLQNNCEASKKLIIYKLGELLNL